MRLFLLALFICFVCTGYTQDLSVGYWLPLKRLEQISKTRIDKCDSLTDYPFKGIRFYGNKKVSFYGFDAADPTQCVIVPLSQKRSWIVKDCFLNTLYPEFVEGSKVILKINNDTLYTDLSKGDVHFFQTFVSKYGGINLKSFWENGLGNLLIKGRFLIKGGVDTIECKVNGTIAIHPVKRQHTWTYKTFSFVTYYQDCSYPAERIIDLVNNQNKSEQFMVKITSGSIDFYQMKQRKNFLEEVKITGLAFSLLRIN